jgi:glycosyltransferase involved in cell wall biosynthesis
VVGYLGRFVPEKGLSLLMAALEGLAARWRAVLVGGGPLEPELRAFAARFPGRVRVVTGVTHDEVPRYLNAMDVLCAPSQTAPRWREQFGRMLVEALACGKPVLGSDSGEIPHTLGGAGWVLPEADAGAWSAALARLADDPGHAAELGQRGLERARTCFAWSQVARAHLSYFDALMEGRA